MCAAFKFLTTLAVLARRRGRKGRNSGTKQGKRGKSKVQTRWGEGREM